MPDEHWEYLKEIFHAALALAREKRAAYLDRACDGNALLRQAVESLLKSHEETGFVDQPAYQAAADMLMQDGMLSAGQTVGRYRIVSLIGEGGMGRVYLAEDTKLHRKVSLKFLSTSVTREHERLRRFEKEARAASALNHPNIITIHEIGEEEGQQFIATEFIEGHTLRERLGTGIELDEALEIAIQVTSALVAAHRVNVIHRDIKPENIMVRKDDGVVKVLDFGLAKMSEPRAVATGSIDLEAGTLLPANTAPGVVMGTVAYMSPEQARGDTIDERTDIWSLGVVLYEMVAGCSPFVAATSNEIISAILAKQPVSSLVRFAPDVPERLQEIAEKALTKDRDERYQTSKDLLIDLKRLKQSLELKAGIERSTSPDGALAHSQPSGKGVASEGLPTTQPSSAEYIVTQVKSHKRAVATALLLLVAAGIAIAGVSFYRSRQKQAAASPPAISSIAVLPFVNVNADPDTEFLSDGMTYSIIERLSQLSGLRVMSHAAVTQYKNRVVDPRAVGTELSVGAVLTGRLIKRNDALTIKLELVNAKDNSHIWGAQYDRKLSELLALQREIPLDVSEKLRIKLSTESKERLTRAHTGNPEAHQFYVKGRIAWETWSLEGAKQAVGFFEEAIRKDPNYALAYCGLADVYLFGNFAGVGLPQKEAHRRAREAVTKALSLDPALGEAHAALSQVLLYDDWDFDGAERELKRAVELSPSHGGGHHQYSHLLLLQGRFDESLVESKKYLEVDPVSESPVGHLCYHYLYSRQYDEAITQCRKAIQYSDSPQGYTLAEAYYQKGMFREAHEEYLKAFARDRAATDVIEGFRQAFARSGMPGFYRLWLERRKSKPPDQQRLVDIAELYARLNEKDQAFEWLEKAYSQHDDGLLRLREELGFDNLRSDQRYFDLLRRIGLPP